MRAITQQSLIPAPLLIRARLWQMEKIVIAIENGLLRELEWLNPAVLKRIVEGGIKSPELRAEWKALLPRL